MLCLLWVPAWASVPDYPVLSGRVVDEAGVLTPQTKARLNALLASDKKNQTVVAIVDSLRGRDGREYGVELARRWQIGQKGKDNGVVILISPKDRYAGIEIGYGLEGILPDGLASRILRQKIIAPLRQNLDYNKAVLDGTAAIITVLNGGKPQNLADDEQISMDDALSGLLTLILIYLILTGKIRGGRGMFFRRGGGSGGGFFGGGGSFGGGGAGGRF